MSIHQTDSEFEAIEATCSPSAKRIANLESERDCLQKIVKFAQDSAAENARIIALLIAAGIVDDEKIEQAREIARWK